MAYIIKSYPVNFELCNKFDLCSYHACYFIRSFTFNNYYYLNDTFFINNNIYSKYLAIPLQALQYSLQFWIMYVPNCITEESSLSLLLMLINNSL